MVINASRKKEPYIITYNEEPVACAKKCGNKRARKVCTLTYHPWELSSYTSQEWTTLLFPDGEDCSRTPIPGGGGRAMGHCFKRKSCFGLVEKRVRLSQEEQLMPSLKSVVCQMHFSECDKPPMEAWRPPPNPAQSPFPNTKPPRHKHNPLSQVFGGLFEFSLHLTVEISNYTPDLLFWPSSFPQKLSNFFVQKWIIFCGKKKQKNDNPKGSSFQTIVFNCGTTLWCKIGRKGVE